MADGAAEGPSTTIGVLGSPWRAAVTPWGAVRPEHGPGLDWWVAADDRWHDPRHESSRRQRRIGGAPVPETAIRVPSGDVIQRIWAVPDDGGLTVVELENASSLPVVVALSHAGLRSARPLPDHRPASPGAPAGAVVGVPVAHRTSLRLALAHDGSAGALSPDLPDAEQVARGWAARTAVAGRIEVPDDALVEGLVAARAALLLDGPPPVADRVGFLLGAAELARLGEAVGAWARDSAAATTALARAVRRSASTPWDVAAAVAGTAVLLRRAGEERGAADAARLLGSLPPVGARPTERPADPARAAAWTVGAMATDTGEGVALLADLPAAWLGAPLAAHGLELAAGRLSFAVRWHGERPALLWEADPAVRLRAPALDPEWSTQVASGEALLRI